MSQDAGKVNFKKMFGDVKKAVSGVASKAKKAFNKKKAAKKPKTVKKTVKKPTKK
jgi:hypothetical protein